MPKFGNGNGNVRKTKDQLYYEFFSNQIFSSKVYIFG
jgi:hypothetical protein